MRVHPTVSISVLVLSFVQLAGCAREAPGRAATARAASPEAAQRSPGTMSREAAPGPERPDGPIAPALRAETIAELARLLADKYVFPDKAARVRDALLERQRRGEYNAITTGDALAAALNAHVGAVLKDAHFRVRFSLQEIPKAAAPGEPSKEEEKSLADEARLRNGGFERVERLPGNIGYLEVRSFSYIDRGGAAAAAAMEFVADTDALIIDIRRNGGGEPDMVATLCSYFFAKPVHLNDLYFRPENETRQFWTLASVPGRRYLDREVYVLTSKETGSGAEEFAYDLKNLKRATLVGETTWGGAHPGDVLRLSAHFDAFIPTGRAENPITKTNWEGVGVKPDIEVKADDALRVAQIKLIEKRLPAVAAPDRRRALEQRLRELNRP